MLIILVSLSKAFNELSFKTGLIFSKVNNALSFWHLHFWSVKKNVLASVSENRLLENLCLEVGRNLKSAY